MKKMTGIILMAFGVILLISGFILYQQNSKKFSAHPSHNKTRHSLASNNITEPAAEIYIKSEPEVKPEKYVKTPTHVNSNAEPVQPDAQTQEEIYKQKGDDFERFVAENFDPEFFTILEWTSDKAVNGMFVMSNLNPDMVLQYGRSNNRFAVECKYRSYYIKDEIEFTYPEQLQRYKNYEKEKGIPVFIAIGIGGTPKSPKSLFVVPVKDLTDISLSRRKLSAYYKNPNKKFFYNLETKSLN